MINRSATDERAKQFFATKMVLAVKLLVAPAFVVEIMVFLTLAEVALVVEVTFSA